MRKFP